MTVIKVLYDFSNPAVTTITFVIFSFIIYFTILYMFIITIIEIF